MGSTTRARGTALAGLFLACAATAATQSATSPLLDAAKTGDTERVVALLGLNADVTATDPDGTTALHWAAYRSDGVALEALLGAGADATATTRLGVTPLGLAATLGHPEILRLLLEAGADPNQTTGEGETPLMTVARAGNAAGIEVLLAHGADIDSVEGWRAQTSLMWAAAADQGTAARALIRGGANLHSTSSGGYTPLLFASREGNLDALTALLEAGANPDDALPNGTSALGLAVYNAEYEAAELLLEAGANANADGQGWVPLHQVVWTRRPNLGRNPPFPVPLGRLDGLDMARLLVEHGADPNHRQVKEPRDGNRNMLDRAGATAFLLAAKAVDVEMMRLLAELGADATLTTYNGATPMMAAAGVGIWKIGENPGTNDEALAAVELAWELGNDVNTVDGNGDTALHGAIHRGAEGIVRFLHDKGAHLDAVNETGWTPLSIAEGVFYPNTFNRHPDLVTLLESLGADPTAGNRRPMDLAPWEREALNANAPD